MNVNEQCTVTLCMTLCVTVVLQGEKEVVFDEET